MTNQSSLCGKTDKLKRALLWMSATLQEHPEKKRSAVLQEAELRFDLTPLECEFLDKHLSND